MNELCGSINCPPGTTLIDGLCQSINETGATINAQQYNVNSGSTKGVYGNLGGRFYLNVDGLGFPLKAIGSSSILYENATPGGTWTQGNAVLQDALSPYINGNVWRSQGLATEGRLNRATVWPTSGSNAKPYKEWIGFSQCINVPETKEYQIGLAADNRMRFKINGELIVAFEESGRSSHFNYWHVIAITLNQGVNIIEMTALNEGAEGAFAAEIYDAPYNLLIPAPAPFAVDNIYLWSTRDLEVTDVFTIGGETIFGWNESTDTVGGNGLSGSSCPEGYTLNPTGCTTGECVQILYEPPTEIECCYLITNCKNPEDTYLINFSPSETNPLYQNSVFELTGNNTYFAGKCFILNDLVICTKADVENVTVAIDHGLNNCLVCNPSLKVQSCDNPEQFEYLSMIAGSEPFVKNNIYEFDLLSGCYAYIEEVFNNAPSYFNVAITNNTGSDDCLICSPCLLFRNCETLQNITVRLAIGQTDPAAIGDIVKLGGNIGIDSETCYQFRGYTTCDSESTDYLDLTIVETTGCVSCSTCNPIYTITDCSDSTNTMTITWPQAAADLDLTQIYVFDFNENICWQIAYIPPLDCDTSSDMSLEPANILSNYVDCATCNALCYRIRDCETLSIVGYSSIVDISAYVGKTIKWQTQTYLDTNPDPIEWNCGTVEQYICRLETYTAISDVFVENCFKTCEECEYVAPEIEETEKKTGRKQQPGYEVPDCHTTKTCK
jgi:hypothetical protein